MRLVRQEAHPCRYKPWVTGLLNKATGKLQLYLEVLTLIYLGTRWKC